MDTETLRKTVADLCRPVVKRAGFDLILVEWGTRQGRAVLRLYVDRLDPQDGNGVTLDDCVSISRQVSAVLDVEDVIQSAYSLEVSSPGIDRPLTRPEHFRRFMGQRAKLRLKKRDGIDRRRYSGTICEVDDQSVTLEVDGTRHTFPLDQVDRANLVGER
jgi:ribosome maturation factor RimP